jgi:TctA family transporter
MLTLGLPSNPTMALMIGALMIQGIAPGPRVMTDRPELFWGVVASMWVGNVMLVILNLPLVGIWTRLLRVPYRLLFPAIVVFCSVGVFAVNQNFVGLFIMAFFAIFGYAALKFGCEPAPFVLAFILGPLMEQYLRRAMLISRGDPTVFVTEPISLSFLIASAILLAIIMIPVVRIKREQAMQ